MELEVDPKVLLIGKIVGGLLILGIVIWIALSVFNFIASIFVPQPEKPLTPTTQFEVLNWSICQQQQDALQMYIQNPDSTHPSVGKLRNSIKLYDAMADELGRPKFSVSVCGN